MPEQIRVIRSAAGRDRDTLLAVVGEKDGFVLTADGRRRPIAAPKRKNPRHTLPTGISLPPEAMRSDKALRRALRSARLTAGAGENGIAASHSGDIAGDGARITADICGGPQTEPKRSDN